MIVNQDFPTPKKFGVIFIDCWDSPPMEFYFRHLVRRLTEMTENKTLDGVVKFFATYNYNMRHIDQSFINSIHEFLSIGKFQRYILSTYLNSRINNNDGIMPEQLTVILKECLDSKSFLIHDNELFDDLRLQVAPELQDWIVVGGGWDKCYHNRSMGVKNFQLAITELGLNFYSPPWGINDCDKPAMEHSAVHYENDALTWYYNGEIYKLGTQK